MPKQMNFQMSSPSIIFGLRPFPRPPKTGYFYYKLPPRFSEWNVRTIAVLDLYNVDETYLSNIFDEGIRKMLHREGLSGEAACAVLENYDTENIREFAMGILKEVVQGYVVKMRSDPQISQIDADEKQS
ncbi:MAG: hypothetical protein R6U38_03905 [Desulfatiglandaceae bacterium]